MNFFIRTIIEECAREYNVTFDDGMESQRYPATKARHIAMYLIYKHTRLSQSATGAIFHRDHSTCIYAEKKVDVCVPDKVLDDIMRRVRAVKEPPPMPPVETLVLKIHAALEEYENQTIFDEEK